MCLIKNASDYVGQLIKMPEAKLIRSELMELRILIESAVSEYLVVK